MLDVFLHSAGVLWEGCTSTYIPPWWCLLLITLLLFPSFVNNQVASAFDWEGALEEGSTRPAYLVGENGFRQNLYCGIKY